MILRKIEDNKYTSEITREIDDILKANGKFKTPTYLLVDDAEVNFPTKRYEMQLISNGNEDAGKIICRHDEIRVIFFTNVAVSKIKDRQYLNRHIGEKLRYEDSKV